MKDFTIRKFEKVSFATINFAYLLTMSIFIVFYAFKIVVSVWFAFVGNDILKSLGIEDSLASFNNLFWTVITIILATILFVLEVLITKVFFGMAYDVKRIKHKEETNKNARFN